MLIYYSTLLVNDVTTEMSNGTISDLMNSTILVVYDVTTSDVMNTTNLTVYDVTTEMSNGTISDLMNKTHGCLMLCPVTNKGMTNKITQVNDVFYLGTVKANVF